MRAFGGDVNILWALICFFISYSNVPPISLRSYKYLFFLYQKGHWQCYQYFLTFSKVFLASYIKVLVVQAKPLSFHTYYLFHIGGVDNTPKRSYLLFSLYSKGYWRCCLWPLHCHKYFMIHIRQYCRCSYTPLHSFIFFPFCVIKDLGNVTNIPYTPSRIGYNLIWCT